MEIPLNGKPPTVMWIDLNSCFASIEQQANPLIRNKPVGVAAYTTPNGCVVSPSVEAKLRGCKVGMTVRQCRELCPEIVILPPDPPKYRAVHLELRKIMMDYSPDVFPRSIDEFCVNFAHTPSFERGLITVGKEIKERILGVGDWLRCNVGIGTNGFLAKTAASLHKPDGLDVITAKNLIEVFSQLKLTDLCGINKRYEARLNVAGIFTPLEFLSADPIYLKQVVFKSINGLQWHDRLRGYEVDDIDFGTKSFGRMYSLPKHTDDPKVLSPILMKMCDQMGVRMRRAGYASQGVHLALRYTDYELWHVGKGMKSYLYSTDDLYRKIQLLFNLQEQKKKIAKISVSCYDLTTMHKEQLPLFEDRTVKMWRVTDAMDEINTRYGSAVIRSAMMLGIDNLVIDRISFGGMKEVTEDIFY